MNHDAKDPREPRWLRLAATLRAEPAPDTPARVRRRIASRAAEPAWFRWLGRPVAVAASAALLVVSAVAGQALLDSTARDGGDDTTLTLALLGDDGEFGLELDRDALAGTAPADSEGVTP